MERVIRISSQQSGDFNDTNNLVDFMIPPAQYNFRDSYLELMTSITSDGAVVPVSLVFGANTNTQLVPNSKWVHRSRVRSMKYGVVEEIQDNDVLRQNLELYTRGLREIKDKAFKEGGQVMDIPEQQTNGIFTELRNQFGIASTYRQAPINVALKDIFELGKMPNCPVDAMGGLHLNLELNAGTHGTGNGKWSVVPALPALQNVSASIAGDLQGSAGNTLSLRSYGNAGDSAGVLINRLAATHKPGSSAFPIFTTRTFADREDFPLYVGAKITLAGSANGGAPALGANTGIIESITWVESTPATNGAPFDTAQILLEDATNGFSAVGQNGFYSSTLIGLATAPTLTFRTLTANLVLKQILRPVAVRGMFSYMTFESEKFSQTANARLQQTFRLPPNCVNVFVVFPNATSGYSLNYSGGDKTLLKDFRVRVNNQDIVNRSVEVSNADTKVAGDGAGVRSGQYMGLLEQFFKQAGMPLNSYTEAYLTRHSAADTGNTLATQIAGKTLARTNEVAVVAFPVAETQDQKFMEIIANSLTAELSQVIVFKQVVRSVNL